MISKNLQDLVNKKSRKNQGVKAAQKFFVGIGVAAAGVVAGILFVLKSRKETREDMKNKAVNSVEKIDDAVQKNADKVKDFSKDSAEVISNAVKDADEKTEDLKKDIKDGYHEIKHDVDKTNEKISKELNKPAK